MLINCLLSWLKHRCNCSGDSLAGRRCQASLVEEAQDGVLHHNTWSSGTSCGSISPYTLFARLGLEDLAHHEKVQGLVQLRVCARKQDVEIKEDSSRLE